MKILILCFNFPPDLGAGSFRMGALVNALQKNEYRDLELHVLTTHPNRYANLDLDCLDFEEKGAIKIHRVEIPSHKSGMRDQAWSYLTYIKSAFSYIRSEKNFDLVFATSSRLMTAVLGWHLSKKLEAPLYLDIRDLFTDTLSDILKNSPARILLPIFRLLEKKSFNHARKINVVSKGFLPHIKRVAPDKEISVFSNGIDEIFLNYNFESKNDQTIGSDSQRLTILYAGNIGDGQGLHKIVPEAADQLKNKVCFRIIGDGGRQILLKEKLEEIKVGEPEVYLQKPLPREELLNWYAETDILFLHLNDFQAFQKVLPSKIFEYAATGKPIIAGVSGYAAEFLREHVPQAIIIEPCNVLQLVNAVNDIIEGSSEPRINPHFKEQFARKNLMKLMAKDILSIIPMKTGSVKK